MTFSKLIEELGNRLGADIEDAGGAFALEIDGETVVLQLAGGMSGDILVARADLGEMPVERRTALATSALEANYLYQGTGGATLAVNPSDGHLHLHRYDWLDRIDVDRSIEIFSRFADTAATWRRLVFEAAEAAPADNGNAASDITQGRFIPV